MPDVRPCPSCGYELPARAPEGLCPRCLLLAGLASDALSVGRAGEVGATMSLEAGRGGVLETIAATLGTVPRILLRDTDAGHEPPLVRPDRDAEADGSTRYRIDGEIARGGMGSVLRGRDPDLGRDVAIKVLREELLQNPDMVRRFVEEAQIGGQLQHPGIVPIYELGAFADRRPFFSMKLVKGHTLAGLLANRSRPTDGLPRLLAIFESIAQTVAYAHARGVIHRDLKPSNVMVGSFGEVQVMDWGLAKVLPRGGASDDATAGKIPLDETVIATGRSGSGDSDTSRAGSVMGTPSYMPPEQARGEIGEIDERADVFALGSILCEILTGGPAYSGPSSAEILGRARRADLTDALARLDACGADAELTGLARMCLQADPAGRPRDARVVAEAMVAHLTGVQERLRTAELDRVAARGRARLTAALAASIGLVALLGGGGWTWVRSERAARAASTAREVDKALQEATILWGRARSAQPGDLVPWTEALARARQAEALLANGGPDAATDGRVRAVVGPLAREHEQAVAAERDRRLLVRLGEIVAPIDGVQSMERGNEQLAAAFREAGLDVDKLPPAEVGARIASRPDAAELAASLDVWTFNRRHLLTRDEAGALRLVAVAKVADPDPWRNRLRDAITDGDVAALRRLAAEVDPDRLPVQSAERLAGALVDLGGDTPAAVALLRPVLRRHPDDFWANWDLAGHLCGLDPPRREEAIRHYMAAVALRPRSGVALFNLAWTLADKGDHEEAIATARDAIRLQPRFLGGHRGLAHALDRAGRRAEAIATLVEATRTPSDDLLNRAYCYQELGNFLGEADRADEAIAAYKEAVRLKPDLADAYSSLGGLLFRRSDRDGTIAAFREAIRLRPSLSDQLVGLAEGRTDETIAMFRGLPRDDPANADALVALAQALKMRGRLEESVAASRQAIRLKPYSSRAHQVLGWALLGQRDWDGAIAAYREAIRLKPFHVMMEVVAHDELAYALRRKGRFDEAIGEYRTARALGPQVAFLEGRVAETERESALVARLPAVLKGDDRPRDTAEGLAFAYLCNGLGRHAAAVRFWAEALAAEPKLGEDRNTVHRYNAACDTALAGCGAGKDEPSPDVPARAKLRRQALEWLGAENAVWAALLDGRDPKARDQVARTLRHWQVDTDLTGVRGADGLARLSEAERKDWQALWADVDALLKKAEK